MCTVLNKDVDKLPPLSQTADIEPVLARLVTQLRKGQPAETRVD
jgi:hypothetical protein